MSTRRDQDPEDNNGQPVDEGLLLAESTRVPDLPGVFTKKVILGPDEMGFVTSGGNVVSQLSTGPNKVGWSFLGFGAGKREVIRIHNRPFRLRLNFSNLLSKGYETLDAIIHVTASVLTPSLFHTTVLRGRDSFYTTQLESTIAAGVDDLVQVKVTETDGQALRHDSDTQKRLMDELHPHLARALAERGLQLESVDLAAFQNPGEADELMDELEEAERLISSGTKPGREDMQRMLGRLRTAGLALLRWPSGLTCYSMAAPTRHFSPCCGISVWLPAGVLKPRRLTGPTG